ncbi:hypothetical protein EW146_g8867 [Bondarzewia mesenterica]|uniref:Uncharacterized protein n=1 Tax=Bondarzewia mesenterica TaxID=1095465 RepID=A0A4S4LAX5_9AGAM|nr:hypothetical protein EW146_g8867 [Bondarzewia mesenterica]
MHGDTGASVVAKRLQEANAPEEGTASSRAYRVRFVSFLVLVGVDPLVRQTVFLYPRRDRRLPVDPLQDPPFSLSAGL